jgi:NADH:ubiquinone oxidoreductase subunit 3 (subunit A)
MRGSLGCKGRSFLISSNAVSGTSGRPARTPILIASRELHVHTAPPSADFLTQYASVLVFLLVIVGLLAFVLVLWKLLRPQRLSEEKDTTYECGEEPVGSAWVQFNIRFYVFALIFIVFDVEAVFLLPWAVVFRELGVLAYLEGFLFILVLVIALAYVWRKGDLAWVRPEDRG